MRAYLALYVKSLSWLLHLYSNHYLSFHHRFPPEPKLPVKELSDAESSYWVDWGENKLFCVHVSCVNEMLLMKTNGSFFLCVDWGDGIHALQSIQLTLEDTITINNAAFKSFDIDCKKLKGIADATPLPEREFAIIDYESCL